MENTIGPIVFNRSCLSVCISITIKGKQMFPTKIKIEWEPCPLLRLNPSWVLGRFSQLFLIPFAVLFFCIPWLWARNARKSIETLLRWYQGSIYSLNIEVVRKTVKGSLCLEEVSWVRWLADWSRDPLLFNGHHLRFWLLLCSFYLIPPKSLSRASVCLWTTFTHWISELCSPRAWLQLTPSRVYLCIQPQLTPVLSSFISLWF